MRFVILYLFMCVTLLQATVIIDSNHSNITDFELEYFIDDSEKLQFNDVKDMKFKKGKNSDTLGAKVTNTWIKIKLFNSTSQRQILTLHHDLAYFFPNIHYFEVDSENNLINKKMIKVYSSNAKNEMDGSDALYKFVLDAQKNKTIYINQKTLAYHYYNFSIRSLKESSRFLIYQKVDGVLFVGLLFALAIYNLFIFFSTRYKEYLYYSLYLISATVWIFYIYGSLAHYFQIYGELSFRFNFALMFIPIFLVLFVQTIFETKTKYKMEHKFLNSIIVILSANFIYGIIDFSHAIQLLSSVLNYTLIVFMIISISIYKKGNKIIKIFLLAHTFYLIFNVYAMLFYMGLAEFNYISFHGIGIGIIIEALMLSYLVSYKFKVIEEEKKISQLLLVQKTKMADMGEMVSSIAHQWRQPLSTIGVSSGILREKKIQGKLSDMDFIEELYFIDSNIEHMSQTVEDFLSYFKPNKTKQNFYIVDVIDRSLLIIGNTLYKNEIDIILDIDKELKIFGQKEEFIQVLISLITNAIYALKNKEKKSIQIIAKHEKNKTVLEIIDNAGGVKKEILTKIFDPYFTTKQNSKGTGLGLYISKGIIQNSMNGDIKVENTKDGAKFSIII